MKMPAAFVLSLLMSLPATAVAETAAEREACIGDAFRLCSSAIPDRHSVFLCLIGNQRSLSAPCREVIARNTQQTQQSARERTTDGRGPRPRMEAER